MGIAIREIDSAGNRIAAINGDKKIRIWSADTCELLQIIDHGAKHVAFMHGQDRLLSVDYNEVAMAFLRCRVGQPGDLSEMVTEINRLLCQDT